MSEQRVCLVSRVEPATTGTSRYVSELASRLPGLGWSVTHISTAPQGRVGRALAIGRPTGMDLNRFFASYPLRLSWPGADIYHLTVQTYASALRFGFPPGPVVVTVHDVIPYLVRNDRRLNAYRHPVHRFFDLLAVRSLSRANALLTDSEWTKRTLVGEISIAAGQITTVPLGVDTARYRPRDVSPLFRQRHDLPAGRRYVLYVGSEDPRKNLDALWSAFREVLIRFPDAMLLKVGRGHFSAERAALERRAVALGISHAVRFLEDVPEADLPLLYNVSDVYVQSSILEGFGLPVLEALACGASVVCARTSALVEVAGADSILVPPTADGLEAGISHVLSGRRVDSARRVERRAWAARFSWERTASETDKVYRSVQRSKGGSCA